MDITTLAAARAYTDKQRLGYTEPAKVLTFDISNYTEEDYVLGELAKISDEPVDLSKVAEVMVDVGEKLVFSDLTVGVLPDGLPFQIPHSCLFGELEGEPVPLVFTLDTTDLSLVGTYVTADAFRGYIKFAEVVHKIDEKYLPSGGGLPVVELTTTFMAGGDTVLTEDDIAKLNGVSTPFIGKYTIDVGGMVAQMAQVIGVAIVGGLIGYYFPIPAYGIFFVKNESGSWSVELS